MTDAQTSEQRVRAAVPGAYIAGDYSMGCAAMDSFDVIDRSTGKVIASGHTPARAWDNACKADAVVAYEAQHRPKAVAQPRSLVATLEELCPGVGKRNGSPTCVKCSLPWPECRCDSYVQPKMTTDEDEIPDLVAHREGVENPEKMLAQAIQRSLGRVLTAPDSGPQVVTRLPAGGNSVTLVFSLDDPLQSTLFGKVLDILREGGYTEAVGCAAEVKATNDAEL